MVSVGESSHFWHRYLACVDYGSKVWLQVIRETAGFFVHLVIMGFMFDQLWRSQTEPDTTAVMGWPELMNFAVYFGRYTDNSMRISAVLQYGITSDVVCSYRCVIRELPAPEEQAFREWGDDKCCICQSPEDDRLALCAFPCDHFFHRDCIKDWLKTRMSCPLCQRAVWLENGVVKMDNLEGDGGETPAGIVNGPDEDDVEGDFGPL